VLIRAIAEAVVFGGCILPWIRIETNLA